MTALQTARTMRLARLLLGSILTLALLAPPVGGAVDTATEATIDVADLERLLQQLQDPQQREQFIKTLQALIATAKQGHSKPAEIDGAGPLLNQSQGIFFAYGKLTEHLSEAGRNLGRSLASLPVMLLQLPERLMDSSAQRMLTSLGVAIGILVALGVMLQALASRLETRLRAYAARSETRPMWRRGTCAPLVIGLAIMPYVVLLMASGIVFSIFPVGAVPSGLTALVIATLICYRLVRTLALFLLNPEEPRARLLPISDRMARVVWTWVLRLIRLSAAYYLITHTLLTIGVSEEIYALVRGVMIVAIGLVLSVIVLRLMRWQRKQLTAGAESRRRGFWSQTLVRLQPVWPIIVLGYIWCTAFFALATFHHGTTYMVMASVQTVVVIGASLLLVWVGNFLYTRAVTINDRLGQHLPGFEVRTRRYLMMSWVVVRSIITLLAIMLILQAWGVWTTWFFTSPIWGDLLTRLVILLMTVALVGLVVDFSTFASRKLTEAGGNGLELSRKRKTLIPLLGTTVKYAALAIGGLVALQQLGVNVTPILAGMGIVSLAVGFGAQTLVKDIINGLFMLFEDSIAVGDVVTIKGTGGLVEAVNLRTLWLRDLDGRVHVIPNSQVEMISNMTKDFSYYVLDVNVAYREDTDDVMALLREIDEGMRHDMAFASDMLEPIDILGVDRFADSAVIIRARLKTKPIRQWYVGREFNRRMKKVFNERGIEIPFPAQTIYWGQPKQGTAPPLQLYVQNFEVLGKTAPGDRQALHANANVPDGK
jgi:moderate conductance mechanosensitive channel